MSWISQTLSASIPFLTAFIGWYTAHFFACKRQKQADQKKFLLDELEKLLLLIDCDIFQSLRSLEDKEDKKRFVLSHQTKITTKVELICNGLKTIKPYKSSCKSLYDNLKQLAEIMTGDQFSEKNDYTPEPSAYQKIQTRVSNTILQIQLKVLFEKFKEKE